MATGSILALCTLILLTAMTMTNLSITAMRLTQNGRDKAISLSLAEAGIDDGVDRLRLNNAYTGTGSAIELRDSSNALLGSYSTTTVGINPNLVDVYSTGTTVNEKPRQVRARVAISGLAIGDGAMISNGSITVDGSVDIRTDPIDRRNAHVRANGNVTFTGGAASVDGRIAAAGTVTMASGISTDTLFPTGQSGAARIPFPSRQTKNAWKSQWIAEAQAGGSIPGFNGTRTITAPIFVNGNISLSAGETLTINGTGTVYVKGSITMRGSSKLINTVKLVVEDKFDQRGLSAALIDNPVYEADGTWSFIPPTLMALSEDFDDAISLTGNASNNQYSMIYAVNGGIDVAGNVSVRGALIAGGRGATINAHGNYSQLYPDSAVTTSKIGNAPAVISWIEM